MNTPCPVRLTHCDFTYARPEYRPEGRRDLGPIFELVAEEYPPTPPPTPNPKQKAYFGKRRMKEADI